MIYIYGKMVCDMVDYIPPFVPQNGSFDIIHALETGEIPNNLTSQSTPPNGFETPESIDGRYEDEFSIYDDMSNHFDVAKAQAEAAAVSASQGE